MALKRMPYRPHSAARLRVRLSTPALAAADGVCVLEPQSTLEQRDSV